MSSFAANVRNKKTGEIKRCLFFDDYFGRHKYGMVIEGTAGALNDDEFNKEWERVEDERS